MFFDRTASVMPDRDFIPVRASAPYGRRPSILAIGDSWFFYPMPGGSLIDGIKACAISKRHEIRTVGENGASLADLVHGRHSARVQRSLRDHGPYLKAVMLSAGGNDLVERDGLLAMLLPDCSRAVQPSECFEAGDGPGTLAALIGRLMRGYETLIDWIVDATASTTSILVHDYDNAVPSGKSVFPGLPAWFKPVFEIARIPMHLRAECVIHILDQFTCALHQIADRRRGRVVLVRSRGTLGACDWANELHPTRRGFRMLATTAWRPVLSAIGIA